MPPLIDFGERCFGFIQHVRAAAVGRGAHGVREPSSLHACGNTLPVDTAYDRIAIENGVVLVSLHDGGFAALDEFLVMLPAQDDDHRVSAPDAKGTTNQAARGAGALFRASPGCGPKVAALLADR